MLMCAKVIERTSRPRHRQSQALFGALAICGILRALVEGHADVRAQRNLDIHGMFRSKKVRTPVEMRPESHAFIGDFAQLREAVNLKSAGVSQHGARPADESMQAAHAANRLVSRTKIKMIGIAENDLCAERFDDVLRHGLHAAGRSHRHEHGSFHGLMRQLHLRAPSAGLRCVQQVECEAHFVILVW